MSQDFDPYLEWLGIPASEQPPDHYRLLGVSRFESDVKILRAAADQRFVYLRTFQLSPHTRLAERLLNEVAAAKVCLLDTEKKAVYDAELRDASGAAVQTLEPPPPPQVLPLMLKEPPPAPPPIQSQSPPPFKIDSTAPASTVAARVRRGNRVQSQRTARTIVLFAQIILGGIFGLAAGCFLLSLAYPNHPILVVIREFFHAETPTPNPRIEPPQDDGSTIKPHDPPPPEPPDKGPQTVSPHVPPVGPELPKEVAVDLGGGVKLEMNLIPAGEFMMGSGEPAEEAAQAFKKYSPQIKPKAFRGEYPQHRVRITEQFYLGKHEVTVGQFRQFVSQTGYKTDAEKNGKGGYGFSAANRLEQKPEYTWHNPGFSQGDEHPVVIVSWSDAAAFCDWLSRREGKTYRLPTEAEWEYACRAGTKTRFYCGDDPEAICRVGNVTDATAKRKLPGLSCAIAGSDGYVFTAPVGKFQANGFRLYDMHGNVWEWCSDWYAGDYYQSSPEAAPRGPTSGQLRVFRGGSYCGAPTLWRSSGRGWHAPGYCAADLGFRVARDAFPEKADPSAVTSVPKVEPVPQPVPRLEPPVVEKIILPSGRSLSRTDWDIPGNWHARYFPENTHPCVDHFPSDAIRGVYSFDDHGRLHGWCAGLNQDGKLRVLAKYYQAHRDGPLRAWDDSRRLVLYAEYIRGNNNGVTCLFRDGNPPFVQEWDKGQLIGEYLITTDGNGPPTAVSIKDLREQQAKEAAEAQAKLCEFQAEMDKSENELKRRVKDWWDEEEERQRLEKKQLMHQPKPKSKQQRKPKVPQNEWRRALERAGV